MVMKKIKLLFTTALAIFLCISAQAQFGARLGKAIENAAKDATVRKAEQKTDKAVGSAIDKATDPDTYRDEEIENKDNKSAKEASNDQPANTKNAPAQTPQSQAKADEMAYSKFDFVSGDVIIFEDDCTREKLGEFPSQWDLLHGNSEIASVNGEKAILFVTDTEITPLMKTPKNYLPESFTIEFDFYVPKEIGGYWRFSLNEPNKNSSIITFEWWTQAHKDRQIETRWISTSGDSRSSDVTADLSRVGWHHLSLSFNQRALKIYVDGARVVNVPNVAQAGWFTAKASTNELTGYFLRNIRIAKGAVPLYDRMMSDGKFITYGITFDVGKSTIKPESMGEINRIVTMMKENGDLKFSVEGHTDSTGSAPANQTLSEARSQAVVDKLVENGINKDRFKAAGKGQTTPIADNSTDEGRAKNRRVEFVKI
jgi:outer membrane protein OmpA-like peptidoglycan-associated protein